MYQKGGDYQKLNDGTWDFDTAADMMFSFWVLSPVPKWHPKREELAEVGIKYMCNCPQFNHYHVCKHVIALGLHRGEIAVPVRFSTTTIGTRKAPAGASLKKRAKALVVDA